MISINFKAAKGALYVVTNQIKIRFKLILIVSLLVGFFFITIPTIILVTILLVIFFYHVQKQYKKNINDENFLPDGTHTFYIQYVSPKVILTLKNGKRDGLYSQYFKDGIQKQFEKQYSNGLLNGSTNEYYENGQIKSLSIWKAGKQNGLAHSYNPDGLLIRKSNFINDEYGIVEEYYKNGSLRFINLKENYTFFSENNKKKCEIIVDFKSNQPKGVWINYNNDEKIDYTLNFDFNGRAKNDEAKVLKSTYYKSGNEISSEIVTFKVKPYFSYNFSHNYFRERFENEAIITSGFKGPPGAISSSKIINLFPIYSIDDLLFINI